MKLYDLDRGDGPVVISIPHTGVFVPEDIKDKFTPVAKDVPDTDWHVDKLYDFAREMGATVIRSNFSRYVADMNRPPDNKALYPGQTKVSLCPEQTFDGQDIYQQGHTPDDAEVARRLEIYWQPYHNEIRQQIARAKHKHGYAVLYDAHSIKQSVPRLFEGKLPLLNLGTAAGQSCSHAIEEAAYTVAKDSEYSCVLNGRFIGGYITRHYGAPKSKVHAFQMEIAQTAYMDEESGAYDEEKAARLKPVLKRLLHAIADNAGAGIESEAVG